MSITLPYFLDMVPGGPQKTVVRLNQYDDDFTLTFKLYASTGEFTIEDGTTVKIRGTKPDGNGYSVDCTLDVEEGIVTVEGDKQITAVDSKGVFELTLYKDDKELNTANFIIWVEHAALDLETVASDSKVAELYAIYGQADDIITAGGQYASYQQALEETAAAAAQSAAAAKASEDNAADTYSAYSDKYDEDMYDFNSAYNTAMAQINEKAEAIAQLTTDAGTISRQALDMATQATNDAADISTQVNAMKRSQTGMQLLLDEAFDGAYIENNALYFTHQGEVVAGPFSGIGGGGGGGGGGDAGNNAVLTVSNSTGWQARTVAESDTCVTSITWSSTEDGNETGPGTLTITINGMTKALLNVPQGTVTVDLASYLITGSNVVKQTIRDTYGNARTVNFSIERVAVSISSTFDSSMAYQGAVSFPYTPVGSVEKTVYFLLDGRQIGTTVTSVSGRQMSFTIPQQSHGGHTFECYFEATINGQTVESNRLYYEIICLETLNTTPIIVSDFNRTTAVQYETILMDYKVYDPIRMETAVTISVNGTQVQTLTVDRSAHTFSYRVDSPGTATITIRCGTTTISRTVTVTESDIHPEAVTDKLVLHMSSAGRSNSENNPAVWEYGNGAGKISASFSDFNWASDGWVTDADGQTCLRVMGGASVSIPFKIFENDFLSTGKTIEIEFSVHNALEYDVPIITCMNGDRGFRFTADKATFNSARSSVNASYTTDTHMRLTFTIQPQSEYRLIYMYIDGEYARIMQYSGLDSFRQPTPVGITIGNSLCGVDIYEIRVYDRFLTADEVLGNYIADRQDVGEMLSLYRDNSIKNEYGNIVINKLSPTLPYVIFTGPASPQNKDDGKVVDMEYVEPTNSARHLAASNVSIKVQGTSSQYYPVKNFKIKFQSGATVGGVEVSKFTIRDTSIPVKTFTLKADVASSESANNIVLALLFENMSRQLGILTPPQQEDSRVRQGMDGFPCVVFWDYGDGPEFVGKYNFLNDKGTFDTFGFKEGDESWDVRSSTSQLTKFHTDVFREDWYTEDLESIYPEERADNPDLPYDDDTLIRPMTEWIYSTWQDNATDEALPEPVTYGTGRDQVTYTHDTAAYRLAKFKYGYADWYDFNNALFFYVFTLVFLMVDNRQKNEHLTYWGDTGKWWELPYDFDTALGNDNRGALSFEYWMEDIDTIDNQYVFNGADNVKWQNFRQAFWSEITNMYRRMRNTGMLSPEYVKELFADWQAAWAKTIWNEDGDFKYVGPLRKDDDTTYLSMAYGSKLWQRNEFLEWRIPYCDSLFDVADALLSIMFRPYYQVTEEQRLAGAVDITVDVYKRSYVRVIWDDDSDNRDISELRVLNEGQGCVVHNPLSFANDAVCAIHNAKMIKDVHGLENLYVGFWDSTNATNLQAIRLGSGSAGYTNLATKTVSVGANRKLVLVDLRNCVNFGAFEQKTLELAQCPNIQEVYLEGTSCLGVTLPNGGSLEVLHLPATTTSLVLRNQKKLTDLGLSVASYSSIDQLWLENMTGIDTLSILRSVPEGTAVRITGFYWEADDADEIDDIFDLFDDMNGINGNGEEVEKAQLSGSIHTSSLRGDKIAEWNERYPTVDVWADSISSYLYYMTWDGSELLKTVTCIDGEPQSGPPSTSPVRENTERFQYTFVGWNTQEDAFEAEEGYDQNVLADRTVYAAYSRVGVTYLSYMTWDGGTELKSVACLDGIPQESAPANPSRTSTAQYNYTFVGWNTQQDAIVAEAGCLENVTVDRNVYAAYSRTVRQYTVTWKNADNSTLATETYNYGETPSYKGTTPTYNGQTAQGWTPGIAIVTGQQTYTASYLPVYTVNFVLAAEDGGTTLQSTQYVEGQTPSYTGTTPTTSRGTSEDFTFNGWIPAVGPAYANVTYTAIFLDNRAKTIRYLMNTLSDYESQTNTKICTHAFIDRTALSTVTAPATEVEGYAFLNCTNLTTVDLSAESGAVYIRAYAFTGCTKLTHLIIRSSTMATLGDVNALQNSLIAMGRGAVYVPSNMVATYKANTNWKDYTIAPISSYPLSDFSTISDSWAEIVANPNYATDYAIGETKTIDFGTYGKHLMEIVAFDTDDRADGNGKARMTWVSKTLITTHKMMSGSSNAGGWEASELRSWLASDIKPLLPSDLRSALVPVIKVQAIFSGGLIKDGQTTADDLWIPSNHEVGFGTTYETTGPVYSTRFNNSNARRKVFDGEYRAWWLRSSSSSNNGFTAVSAYGEPSTASSITQHCVVIGFCI